MLNGDLKNKAIEDLKSAETIHKKWVNETSAVATQLFNLRHETSTNLITKVEEYINSLANTPKEFSKSFDDYRLKFKSFTKTIEEINELDSSNSTKVAGSAAAGVAAGIGTAAFAPTAAMAIATTFGTASTGTAISTLGGAAATKAALAWLGGGALAAGGGGVAGGQALLALAGPVGWAIGGVTLLGAGLFARSKNADIATKVDAIRREVETSTRSVKTAHQSATRIIDLTKSHVDGVQQLLVNLQDNAPMDYSVFSVEMREDIGALINHVNSLAQLLNKKVMVE